MKFRLVTTMTGEDYYNFYVFNYLESSDAKKNIRKHHLQFIAYIAVLSIVYMLFFRWRPSSVFASAGTVLLAAIYLILYKSICKLSFKRRIKQRKKAGELSIGNPSAIEFYDDYFSDVNESTRVEQTYSGLSKVCIVSDRLVLLYTEQFAHIFPIAQLKEQVNCEDFLSFIREKCPNVEYYQ